MQYNLPSTSSDTNKTNDSLNKIFASALVRFRFLSSKLKSHEHNTDAAVMQLTHYMMTAAEAGNVEGIDFLSSIGRAPHRSTVKPFIWHNLLPK